MYDIPFGHISVDSLKVRIPLERVLIRDRNLGSVLVPMRIDDGELLEDEEFKKNSVKSSYKGVSVYFGLESQIGRDKIVRDYLVVLFSSKLLHFRYFEGITSVNVGLVYDRLMSLGVVSFEYGDFLKAECTDVDFKNDVKHSEFKRIIKDMYSNAKDTKKLGQGVRLFNTPTNQGIQWGERKTSTLSYPFLKLYHKGIHMMGENDPDMFSFYAEFISQHGYDLKDVVRVETTIKNKKHFRKHGIENTTLESILNLSQEKMMEFFVDAFQIHMESRSKNVNLDKEETDKLKPMDTIQLVMVKMLQNYNVSHKDIRAQIERHLYNAQQRRRALEGFDKLIDAHIKNTPQAKKIAKLSSFYDSIGYYGDSNPELVNVA